MWNKNEKGGGDVSHTVLIADYWSRCIHSACHSRHFYSSFNHRLYISLIFPVISTSSCQAHNILLLSISIHYLLHCFFIISFIHLHCLLCLHPSCHCQSQAALSDPPFYFHLAPAKRPNDGLININSPPSLFLALSAPSYLDTCAAISQSHQSSFSMGLLFSFPSDALSRMMARMVIMIAGDNDANRRWRY